MSLGALRRVRAGVLDVGFHECGPADGAPVLLLHGFPYDVHAYAEVAPLLADAGCRAIVPYLRGYGPTSFIDAATPRSGQQGALAADLLALLDALALPRAVLAGYDWGGRAACIVAALWPQRCTGLVSQNGYNVHDIAHAPMPLPPADEHRLWYQYYFHAERGRAGLAQNRRALCKLLWQLWSPGWRFDDATFERSAAAFDHPDFVDVVIHSYRHRYALAQGDPAYDEIERRLAAQPEISAPTITLEGADDGVMRGGGSAGHRRHFIGAHEHRVLPGGGHNLPQEMPAQFANAVLDLVRRRVA